jgi:hypothetical protein
LQERKHIFAHCNSRLCAKEGNMKCKTQVGLALGAGYVLGRRHKTRLALAVGAAALTGGVGSAAGRLLRKGSDQALAGDVLGKLSPQVGDLVDTVRGELLEVGKTAVQTAVRSQVDALTSNLTSKVQDRTDALRDRMAEGAGQTVRGAAGARRGGRADDEEAGPEADGADSAEDEAADGADSAEDDAADDADLEDEDAGVRGAPDDEAEEEPPVRRAPARRSTSEPAAGNRRRAAEPAAERPRRPRAASAEGRGGPGTDGRAASRSAGRRPASTGSGRASTAQNRRSGRSTS